MNENLQSTPFQIDQPIWEDLEQLLEASHPPIYFVISPIPRNWYDLFAADGANVEGLNKLVVMLAACPNTFVA